MRKFFTFLFITFICINQCFAYSVKLYDQYGKHIGNAKKNGEQYEFYNLNDEKVEKYEDLFDSNDDKRTITEYSRVIYDQNLRPIGSFTDGIYGNIGPIDTFGTFRYYGHPIYGYPRVQPRPIIILPEYKFRKDGTIRGNIRY